MDDIIGIRNFDSGYGSAGVGFVVVPSEVDRIQYIEDCYRTNTLTIQGGTGYGYIRNIPTDVHVMQNLVFPDQIGELGTAVVWVRDSISQSPVIVASLRKQKDYYALDENQYRVRRGTEKRNVEFFIEGNETSVQLNLLGDADEPAKVDIKLSSENKDSVFSISSDNEINLSSEKAINVNSNQTMNFRVLEKGVVKMSASYSLGTGFSYLDEFKNEINCKEGEINIISEKINHNSGAEPMALGQTLSDLLKEFLEGIKELKVYTSMGPSSVPINIATFDSIISKLDTILSKKSNLE